VAALRGKPFLLEYRDLYVELAVQHGILKNPIIIGLARWMQNHVLRRADRVVVNSPAYKTHLVKSGIGAEKISVIPNGVDPEMFHPQERGESLRKQYNLENKFVVTYAGALGLMNDIETLLNAAAHCKDDEGTIFILAGGGKERENLENKAAKLELNNVIFTGALPKSQMPELLAASDVCVAILRNAPYLNTTYPNKVFDYMAAGRAVLLGIDGVIRDVVETAKCGVFIKPGEAEAMAHAIKELKKDRERARVMGIAGRKYVVEHFHRDQQAAQFVSLVNEMQ